MFVDTHCHLDCDSFDNDRTRVLEQCAKQNIIGIIDPGITRDSWKSILDLSTEHAILHSALGLHPCYVATHADHDLVLLEQQAVNENVIAIGEIGLDFYIDNPDIERQLFFFTRQLAIAANLGKPVLIHARKAHDQVIKYLKQYRPPGGIIHAFNGSAQQAEQYITLGFHLGFGGAYTYPGARKLRRLPEILPLEAWVLETDSPDMTPFRHRYERNSPENISEIFDSFYELHITRYALSAEEMMTQLLRNTIEAVPALGTKIMKPMEKV